MMTIGEKYKIDIFWSIWVSSSRAKIQYMKAKSELIVSRPFKRFLYLNEYVDQDRLITEQLQIDRGSVGDLYAIRWRLFLQGMFTITEGLQLFGDWSATSRWRVGD